MKKIKTCITMALTGLMLVTFAGCNMIERTPESIQKTVLAKVGKETITKGDLDKSMKATLDYLKQQYGDDFEENSSIKDQLKEERKKQLENLVKEKVLLQKADSLGVEINENDISAQVDEQIANYKQSAGTEEQYQSFIQSYGYDDDSFREYLTEQAKLSKIIDVVVKDIDVPEEDIESYYNENQDKYNVQPGAYVNHLLFTVDQNETDETKKQEAFDKAEQLAKEAREKAVAGTSLQDLAESDEYKSVSKFENLKHVNFENSGMVQEFEAAIKTLPAGEISQPVKTQYGWHLILNKSVNTEATTEPLDEVKDDIKEQLLSDKKTTYFNEKYEEYKKELNVKTYEDRL